MKYYIEFNLILRDLLPLRTLTYFVCGASPPARILISFNRRFLIKFIAGYMQVF